MVMFGFILSFLGIYQFTYFNVKKNTVCQRDRCLYTYLIHIYILVILIPQYDFHQCMHPIALTPNYRLYSNSPVLNCVSSVYFPQFSKHSIIPLYGYVFEDCVINLLPNIMSTWGKKAAPGVVYKAHISGIKCFTVTAAELALSYVTS